MRRNLPPLNALFAFEAAARHGSFTRAAEELSVAQPAITRHIAKLENWFGHTLFTRRGSTIELTTEGHILAGLSTTVFDRLELGIRDVLPSNDHEILIGASFGVAHLWLMPRISGMRLAANATVNFLTSDDYRSFDDPSVDCSIRFGNGDLGSYNNDLLFREHCQIIASPTFLEMHPEFDPNDPLQTIDPKHLFDHGDPRANGWMTWERYLQHIGKPTSGAERFTKVLSFPTMLDMVAAGEGVTIGYRGLDDHLIEADQLVRIGTQVERDGHGYYLVYRNEVKSKRPFRRLRDYLLQSKLGHLTT
ncbi:LysR family transcriptional regulator [Cochlodiniinecator piscidefendens]|uniref:LysR family transcriptional regulator n=1 Tax=Cochlodiniinecator piscidefendens TaxID=2715756 RepID=UPI00140A7EF8|nr:LysR family transcriptional regulator [Cochlodiniinecator piscidefendens]